MLTAISDGQQSGGYGNQGGTFLACIADRFLIALSGYGGQGGQSLLDVSVLCLTPRYKGYGQQQSGGPSISSTLRSSS